VRQVESQALRVREQQVPQVPQVQESQVQQVPVPERPVRLVRELELLVQPRESQGAVVQPELDRVREARQLVD
jgi:hypothetical protein